jgi:hypothetical protein
VTALEVCLACNQPMIAGEPDQITHPCCDPDDTALPTLNETETVDLLSNDGWFRQRPGRCGHCGNHPATQGHAATCDSDTAADFLFAGSNQCKDCGDPLNGPGLMQRCRGRHQVIPA